MGNKTRRAVGRFALSVGRRLHLERRQGSRHEPIRELVVMSKSLERRFAYEGDVIVVSNVIRFEVDSRDDNGNVPSISKVINGYADMAGELFHRKAGYVETVYSPDNTIKRGVRIEVVSVTHENGMAAYVSDAIITALMMEGRDWDSILMKVRRKQAAKTRDGYGKGASIGELVEAHGYVFTQLTTAGKEDMDISAWNHSWSARVASKAKARNANKRAGVSTQPIANAFDALFALEVK